MFHVKQNENESWQMPSPKVFGNNPKKVGFVNVFLTLLCLDWIRYGSGKDHRAHVGTVDIVIAYYDARAASAAVGIIDDIRHRRRTGGH